MLSDRQKLILKAIIEEFIESNDPVGSKVLTEKPYLGVSSATIRYDMQYLEENEYLEKTHTSSGRIPSQKGYRFYVDHLITLDEQNKEHFDYFDKLFEDKNLTKEELLQKIVDEFSKMTNYMVVIVGSSVNYSTIKKMEIVPLSDKDAVLLIVTSNGSVQSQKITIPDYVNMDDLLKLIDMFDNAMYDHSVMEISNILSKEAHKPRVRKIVDFHDDILNFLIKAFSRFQNIETYQSGLSRLFSHVEFQNHEIMQNILGLVDNGSLSSILCETNENLNIRIGNENMISPLNMCSIISTPYYIGEDEYGSIGVIGPMRLMYKKVIPLISYIARCMIKLYKDKE